MFDKPIYTCKETCNQEKPCGNRYCSAHPQHYQKKPTTPPKQNSDKR